MFVDNCDCGNFSQAILVLVHPMYIFSQKTTHQLSNFMVGSEWGVREIRCFIKLLVKYSISYFWDRYSVRHCCWWLFKITTYEIYWSSTKWGDEPKLLLL